MDELKKIELELEYSSKMLHLIQYDITNKLYSSDDEFQCDLVWFLMCVENHKLIVEKLKQLISLDIKK